MFERVRRRLHTPANPAPWWRRLFAPALPRGVYLDIAAERVRQDRQWGRTIDDGNSSRDWREYRQRFESRIDHMLGPSAFGPERDLAPGRLRPAVRAIIRANAVKIAALAVAQIDAIDRMDERDRQAREEWERRCLGSGRIGDVQDLRWDAAPRGSSIFPGVPTLDVLAFGRVMW